MATKERGYTRREAAAKINRLIAFLVADWGNRLLKQMMVGDFASVSVMENCVAFLTESMWEKEKGRFKRNPQLFTNTLVFGFRERHPKLADGTKVEKWTYVAVGDGVRNFARPKHMTEEIKYNYNKYWGAIACSQLLQMFPRGHSHIVLALAHPTKSFAQIDDIIGATIGTHHVETIEGKKISFVVREVVPYDEPVGGLVFWSNSDEAKSNALTLTKNSEILVTDIGGGIASFTRVVVQYDAQGKIEFHPVYNQERSPTIPMGVRNVMERFRQLLAADNAAFKGMKEISDTMLDEGLRTGYIILSGDPVDVSTERMQAEAELLDLMETSYLDRMEGGRAFRMILDTGGGMHSYHERLINEFYNHKYVRCASPTLEFVHLANLRGGSIIFENWIAGQEKFFVKELTHND